MFLSFLATLCADLQILFSFTNTFFRWSKEIYDADVKAGINFCLCHDNKHNTAFHYVAKEILSFYIMIMKSVDMAFDLQLNNP